MAPINFEDHIKSKLEQRELKPNPDAWETLRVQLDNSDSKKNRKHYWWLGLAASFIGVLFIASFLFNGNKNETPTVVDIEEIQIDEPDVNIDLSTSNNDEVVDQDENTIPSLNKEKKLIQKQPVIDSKLEKEQEKVISNKSNDAVASRKMIIEEKPTNEILKSNAILTFEEQKINTVAAEIRALLGNNNAISDKEIDALLDAAQKEITLNRVYNEATKTVDPAALLRSVEEDLEESFRDRVFKLLQSGYDGVKTAVAERNN